MRIDPLWRPSCWNFARIVSVATAICRLKAVMRGFALIECTFCADCAENILNELPELRREFYGRPIRPAHMLEKHPASIKRVVKDGGCLKLAS